MPKDNPPPACTECLSGPDVTLLSESKYLASNKAARGKPAGCSDEDNQGEKWYPFPHGKQQKQDKEAWDCERAIYQSHERRVYSSTPVPGDYAHDRTECHREGYREKCDAQRDPGSRHHSREHIPAELIGSEWMFGSRRPGRSKHVWLGERIRQDEWARDCGECDDQ
jgi:hypothetical protein